MEEAHCEHLRPPPCKGEEDEPPTALPITTDVRYRRRTTVDLTFSKSGGARSCQLQLRMDVQGNWWTPGEEEHSVQGVLRVDQDGATLELAGLLDLREQTPGEIVQGQVVFGRDESGRAITLLDASARTRHIGPPDRLTVHA
jgi:hypothetical protein